MIINWYIYLHDKKKDFSHFETGLFEKEICQLDLKKDVVIQILYVFLPYSSLSTTTQSIIHLLIN